MSSDAAALPNSSSPPSWAQHVVPSTGSDQRASRVGRYQNGDKPYAHIKDLQDEAALLDVNENSSV